MAQTLVSTFGVNVGGSLSNVGTLQTATSVLTYSRTNSLANGVGASQADQIFSATRTIAASGTDNLDLNAGSILNPFGSVFSIVRLKVLLIVASSANTNNVVVGGAATNQFTTILGGTNPTVTIRPGGLFMWGAIDATAAVITPSTGDILAIANSGAGTSVTYDLVLVGADA